MPCPYILHIAVADEVGTREKHIIYIIYIYIIYIISFKKSMHNVSMHNPIPFCLIFFIYTYRSPTLSLLMDPCFPLPFPHLSLCEWVTDIAVPLTSLSTDLQGIRSPSDLPVITVTPEPIPIIAAGHVNSQLNQKVSIPKETYWNIESVGPCVSDLLQLGIGSFVVLADCPLNHS